MLKSKNKATNSGCNSTKILKTRNATKYILTIYDTRIKIIYHRKNANSEKKGSSKKYGENK